MSTLSVKENNNAIITAICRDKNGAVQDVTGFAFEFKVIAASGVVVLDKNSSDPTQILATDPTHGKVEIYIKANDTRTKSGDHQYEFKSIDLDGNPETLQGPAKFTVTKTLI